MPNSARRAAPASSRRSSCPLSCALDLVGDRWTMLVVRDLFRGRTRFGEFLASPEGIPTNLLAERLQRLENAGLITSAPYQQKPPRYTYTLTPKGTDLKPVLGALALWSMHHLPRIEPDQELLAALRG